MNYLYVLYCIIYYAIMKTMCPPGYHHNGSVAAHVPEHMIYTCAQVYELPQSHCGDNREGTLFSGWHIYYAHLTPILRNFSST